MPRKNGKRVKGNSLGSALVKSRNRKKIEQKEYISEHKAEKIGDKTGKKGLDSMLEIESVSDFLYNAELTQQQFEVERDMTSSPNIILNNFVGYERKRTIDLQRRGSGFPSANR